ncbi:alpha/beta fold hydrolase [Fodinicurvata sp. EGI_FJ10296]|uniref:alpha/beta fold hydrolase n=1 Tax=Fodinicurvata sp. EGI_FJ10296 TaxID=3231908 RepID=UPI0034547559
MSERILTLPRLGETMETGRIVEWLKQPGEHFRRGETIAEIETDKTVVELPALTNGTILEILAEPGAEVTVDMPLARIEDENAADATTVPGTSEDVTGPAGQSATPEPSDVGSVQRQQHEMPESARKRATPAARRIARQTGVDIETIVGTGPRGRVETADIRQENGNSAGTGNADRSRERIEVSGGHLAVRRWPAKGKRRATALLLHGFAADGSTWLPIGPLLADAGIEAIAFDLPSHGTSTVDPTTIEALSALVRQAATALAPMPDIIVAHSMGALVAADLAASGEIAGLRRLMLISPAGMGHTVNYEILQALAWADTADSIELLLREIGGNLPPPPLAVCRQILAQNQSHPHLPDLADDLAGLAGQRHSLPRRLESLSIPVLVIMGTEDVMFPWVQVASLPPTTAIHLIDGGSHIPHWEVPETIVKLITTE